LAQRLAQRKEWPEDLSACRNLPEVKALREALHADATPALNLMQHPQLPVRVAALAALEFRQNWRPGQADFVLEIAQRASEPVIRATALSALANVDDQVLVESLAGFLRDPSLEVRRAATEALLWDSARRWRWIRLAVRQALADPVQQADGPLRHEGEPLTAEAVADLTAWTSEKGVLAVRAVQTLGIYYAKTLNDQPDDGLVEDLEKQLANRHTPAQLRIELAHVLRGQGKWKDHVLEELLDSANPAPLRLTAAEVLLGRGSHDRAVSTLHDLARMPNREMALATAGIVQRCLGIDLGLPLGQPLPPPHSRVAAEVTRRVMLWANQREGTSLIAPCGR
jgi:hypothetical protein